MSVKDLYQRISALSPAQRALLEQRLGPRPAPARAPAPPSGPGRPAAPAGEVLAPVSPMQRRLWLQDQLEPGNVAYSLPVLAYRLRKNRVRIDVLKRCFSEIQRRHESLRTTFRQVDGEAWQVIAAPRPVPLPLVDLSALRPDARWPLAEQLAAEDGRRRFNLARGPLWRVLLLRMEADHHLLAVLMHHVISDGWSLTVFNAELTALYAAYLQGQPSPLAELPQQYRDFAAWQQSWLAGERLERELAFWRHQLADAPPILELPTDRPRPPVQTHNGYRLHIPIAPDLPAAVAAMQQRYGVTLFMVVLAAFQVLLYRWSGQRHVVVGSPVAGRPTPASERLIGFFVNTVVLSGRLTPELTFEQLLATVRDQALEVFEHQDLPFDRVVEELHPQRDLSYAPIFQVALSLQNIQLTPPRLVDLEVIDEWVQNRAIQTDLVLFASIDERGGVCWPEMEYNTDLFDGTTIRRWLSHLQELLRAVTAEPGRTVGEVLLLAPAERHQLLVEWPGPARGEDATGRPEAAAGCLHGTLAPALAERPEAVAVQHGRRAVTYRELDARANQLGHHLRRLGVAPEGIVALCLERSLDLVVATLAVLKAGGAYLPLDPDHPAERLGFALRDSGARALVTSSRHLPQLAGSAIPRVVLDAEAAALARLPRTPPASGVRPAHLAYVLYTSGSTGEPKASMIPHGKVPRLLRLCGGALGLDPGDTLALFHSPAFDLSVWELWAALAFGARVVIASAAAARSAPELYRLLLAQRVTVVHHTPSGWRQVIAAQNQLEPPPRRPGHALRLVMLVGEALDPRLLAPWLERNPERRCRLWNSYGITETTMGLTLRRITTGDVAAAQRTIAGVSPIGAALPDLQLYVLDPRLRPLPAGVPGELGVAGAGLGRGYLGRPRLTAECFRPHPLASRAHPQETGSRLYRSGDLVRCRPDGDLDYLGRIDQQVQLRGLRVELGEVEVTLGRHPAVAEAVVALYPDAAGSQRLVAYVEPAASGPPLPSARELRRFLARNLPAYMLPSAVVPLDKLPLSGNGKLDRRALPAPAAGHWARPPQRVAPRTRTEERLAELWQDVLEVPEVGAHDDFFELGGHSLLATQLVARTERALGVRLPLRAVFEAPTLAELARRLDELRAPAKTPAASGTSGGGKTPAATPEASGTSEMPPAALPAAGPLRRLERRPEPLPLSFAQQRLWFLDRLHPGDPAYNVPTAWRVHGDVHAADLRASLEAVYRRHQALHTTFPARDGEPCQHLDPRRRPPFSLLDLTALSPGSARQAEAERLTTIQGLRSFDLARDVLMRTLLLRLAADHHQLLVSFHHIVTDGWSTTVLLRELEALYRARRAGVRSRDGAGVLPDLPVQYPDFAVWQRRWLQGRELAQQLAYWRRQLADLQPLELPTDRPRQSAVEVASGRAEQLDLRLSPQLTSRLAALAGRLGGTLFMLLLAAFAALLGRHAGQHDIALGSPFAGRTHRELEGLIGFFVNTLVLRLSLHGKPDFVALMARARELALDAYSHQETPFELLVAELNPPRVGRSPFFQVMFSYQPLQLPDLPEASLRLEGLSESTGLLQFDLVLELLESPGNVHGYFTYDPQLFDATTLHRLAAHLQMLLAAAVEQPRQPVAELPLLTAPERHQLLVEANDTASGDEGAELTTIDAWIAARAAAWPDATAVARVGWQLSYRELLRRAEQLAAQLADLGVGPEVRVALFLPRGAPTLVALLAVLRAGGGYLPLDPAWPAARVAQMLADSGAALVLTRSRLAVQLAEQLPAGPRVLCLDQAAPLAAKLAARSPQPDQLAYVIYTSGSTGRPKGAMVCHRSLLSFCRATVQQFQLRATDRVLQFAALTFDVSVGEVFPTWLAGGTVVLAPEAQLHVPPALTRMLETTAVTALELPPAYWQEWLADLRRRGRRPPAALRFLLIGGERTSREHLETWQGMDRPLYNAYGLTEVTVTSLVHAARRGREASAYGGRLPIGRALADHRVYLLDARDQPVPLGVAGEIHLAGAQVCRGYLGRPGLTAERFLPDPFATTPGARRYRTGDLTRTFADGSFDFLGRIDHQLKLRGFRVEPGEIEAVLAEHPAVREAVVLPRRTAGGDPRLIAWLQVDMPPPDLAVELRAWLGRRLPDYMVPADLVPLARLPLNRSGKVDRTALAQLSPTRHRDQASGFVAPGSDLERRLVAIWEKLLERTPVGVHDDFFALGGHSLLAVRLMARLETELGRVLPLAALFEARTVAGLARLLDRPAASAGARLVAIETAGDEPPLVCVHPIGGNVLCYAELGRALAPEQPVWGLPAPGLDGQEPPCRRVEDLAAHHLASLRARWPRGPYRLAGWSFGGLVAFEMARQLAAAGAEVELVALLDTYLSAHLGTAGAGLADLALAFARDLAAMDGGGSLEIDPETLAALPAHPSELLRHLLAAGQGQGVLPADLTVAQLERLFAVYQAHLEAGRAYRPQPYPGTLTLLRPQQAPLDEASWLAGWRPLAAALDVRPVAGDHYRLLRPPAVATVAAALRRLPAAAGKG